MRILRILKILTIAARHRLDRLLPQAALPLWLKILLLPLRMLPEPKQSPAASMRIMFEQLGPIFVKFGQILSTRRDLFEPDTADELQKLQDQVPPFPSDSARAVVEKNLEKSIDELFEFLKD